MWTNEIELTKSTNETKKNRQSYKIKHWQLINLLLYTETSYLTSDKDVTLNKRLKLYFKS